MQSRTLTAERRIAGVPRAYIRHGLLLVGGPGSESHRQLAPDAARALKAFHDCGWDVVMVGGSRDPGPTGLDAAWLRSVDERDPGAWLLTDQVLDDRWARPLGLRTALVGPQVEAQTGPSRCDVAFRDLRTAALEILARDEPTPGRDWHVEGRPTT